MPETQQKRSLDLSKGVLPISVVVTLAGGVLAAGMWGSQFNHRVDLLEVAVTGKLEDIERALLSLSQDGVTKEEFHSWVELLKAMNPSVQVPNYPH